MQSNETFSDFFLELVDVINRQNTVLQVLFRFPLDKLGAMEMFLSSYGRWRCKGKEFHRLTTTAAPPPPPLTNNPNYPTPSVQQWTNSGGNHPDATAAPRPRRRSSLLASVNPHDVGGDGEEEGVTRDQRQGRRGAEHWLLEVGVYETHFEVGADYVPGAGPRMLFPSTFELAQSHRAEHLSCRYPAIKG